MLCINVLWIPWYSTSQKSGASQIKKNNTLLNNCDSKDINNVTNSFIFDPQIIIDSNWALHQHIRMIFVTIVILFFYDKKNASLVTLIDFS